MTESVQEMARSSDDTEVSSVTVDTHPARPERDLRIARRVGLLALTAVFFVLGFTAGFPFDREQIFFWIIAYLVVGTYGSERGGAKVIRDWLPLALFLLLYDFSRGVADDIGMPLHVTPQIDADKLLFFGEIPTIWLQERLYEPGEAQWWESIISIVYVSHFIVPFAVAGVLWYRSRPAWLGYIRRFLTVSYAGVVTYVLVPAAPPWWAAKEGVIPPVESTVIRGWEVLGLGIAGEMLEKGKASVNEVAAVPSLHAAFAFLVTVFLWSRVRRRWRPLLLLYAVAMVFTLVITGEHYVVDAVLGWIYVGAAHAGWSRWERHRGIDDHEASRADAGAKDLERAPGGSRGISAPERTPTGS